MTFVFCHRDIKNSSGGTGWLLLRIRETFDTYDSYKG